MLSLNITKSDIETLNCERFYHPSPLVKKRMHVIYMKSQGLPHKMIAAACDVSLNSVTNFIKIYNQSGIEGLRQLYYRKPKSQLENYRTSIKEEFEKNPPLNSAQASMKIEEMTGVKFSPSQTRTFMKQLGMSFRKMGHIPAKADPEKQAEFIEETLNPLIKLAQQGLCLLFFVDAAHFVLRPFLCSLWCFARIFIKAPAGRQRFNVLGGINAITQKLEYYVNETYINAESVVEFMQNLRKKYPLIPIYLVMDNARYQKCKLVMNLAKELNINLVFLPSYSPNLNIIERLWKFIRKKVLYGKYYENFQLFKNGISSCLNLINQGEYQEELKSLLNLKFQTFGIPKT